MIKLNLQHFADAGTLVNTTGNYINAYDGSKTEFDGENTLTPTMKTYYDTELLENARAELVRLPGIGGKVADCICLFALHQMDAFPVDTHIKKALELHYPEGFPFTRYQGCAGVMQQYMFYYDLKAREKELL